MKNKKICSFLILFAVCIITAFSFLKSSAVSSQKNEIKTNPDTEYQITYELDGGQFEGEYPKTFKISQETTIPNPIKDGSEFLGWTINDKTDVSPIKDYKIPSMTQEDVKLTANWQSSGNVIERGTYFKNHITSMRGFNNVTEIRFIYGKPNTNGVDVSENKKKSIMANIEGNVLTIASEGEIYANPNCRYMFFELKNILNIKFDNFDTSQVTDMTSMFENCQVLTEIVGLDKWDTSQVTNMYALFYNCSELTSLNVSSWDTSQVTDMYQIFWSCYKLTEIIGLEKWNTSQIIDMRGIFENCYKLSGEITISNPNITNYGSMFRYCSTDSSAKFIVKYKDAETKEIAKQMVETKYDGTTVGNVFLYEEPSTLVNGQTFNSKVSGMSGFDNVTEIRFIKGTPSSGGTDVSEARDKSIMASIEGTVLTIASEGEIFANSDCTNMFNQYGYTLGTNKKINKITFNNFNTSKVTNMDSMFRFCNLLTSLDLSNFDTSKVTNMDSMFRGCYVLREIKGLENFNTSKVTNTINMFYNCADLIGEVTIKNQYLNNYTSMFTGCSTNTGSKFIVKYISPETKEVARQMVATRMEGNNVFLYEETSILPEGQKFNDKIKSLSSFTNVTKVIFDYGIPSDISKYPNVDISENGNIMGYINGDTLYVVSNGNIIANTNSARLFAYCYNLKSIDFTNNFDTSQITQMNSMFETCTNLVEIKGVEKWNTSQVKDISYMFVGCRNLQNVNVTKFNTSKITNMDYTFKECNKLSGEITISNINTNYYREIFKDCSTDSSAKFIVKYTDEATKVVAERMVATKSTNSNVVLGGMPSILVDSSTFHSTILRMNEINYVTEIRFIYGTPNPNGVDLSENKNKSIMANIEGNVLTIASEGEIFANPDASRMFYQMGFVDQPNQILKKINFENFNTSKVIDMEGMFSYCTQLTDIVGLEKWDTSKVTTMREMFDTCTALVNLDVSMFNTSNVKDMYGLFEDCYSLRNIVGLEKWDTSKVTIISSMFLNCWYLNANITIMNPNITDYYNIFYECSTNPKSKFVVNYTSDCKKIAEKIVNAKYDTNSKMGNIVLGTEVGTVNDITNEEEPSVPDTVVLTIKDGGEVATKEILSGETLSLETPVKEGKLFVGYFYDAEYTKPVSERDVISEDTTIYIKWEEVPQVEEAPQEENKDESLEVA